MNYNVAILGGGQVGLLLSETVSRKVKQLKLWLPDKKSAEKLNRIRRVSLQDRTILIPSNMTVVSDFREFSEGNWLFIVALSTNNLEDALERLLSRLAPDRDHVVAFFTKGLVSASVRKKHKIYTFTDFTDVLARNNKMTGVQAAVINGPSLMEEFQDGYYCFLNVGSKDTGASRELTRLLESPSINVETSVDRFGVEISGILKTPIAIACGIAEGLPNCGINFQGELLSVGFREMMRLGAALGADLESLTGRSGLADLIVSGTSSHSRNRSYGEKFVEDLVTGENRPGVAGRLEMLVRPGRIIEREVAQNAYLVEGAYVISKLLEIAKEKKISLPLYQKVFDILSRRATPQELVEVLSGNGISHPRKKVPSAKHKQVGLQYARGQKFEDALEERVFRQLQVNEGLPGRVIRQSNSILTNLERRLEKARKMKNARAVESLPQEMKLWEALQAAPADQDVSALRDIIRFYVHEIADHYNATVRGTLIRVLVPSRFFAGGMYPGAALPYLGGDIKRTRAMTKSCNVLYAPTHRSHLDSLEVGFGLNKLGMPVPRYAADINLMQGPFWSYILKALGAYMVDRERTRNILYLECLTRYSTMMLESGIPSLVYPEGTRSRSGGIEPVKTGLLSTALDAFRFSGREVIIVPIALSYENVPEDSIYLGEVKKLAFNDFIKRRTKVYMDICEPISISHHIKKDDPTYSIESSIVKGWRENMRVLPNQVLARVLTDNQGSLELDQVKEQIDNFVSGNRGNYLVKDPAKIFSRGLKALKKRDFVAIEEGRLVAKKPDFVKYYGTMIPF